MHDGGGRAIVDSGFRWLTYQVLKPQPIDPSRLRVQYNEHSSPFGKRSKGRTVERGQGATRKK